MTSRVDGALSRPLTARARAAVAQDVRGWLRWQEVLSGFRPAKSAVDATPFVALYAHGELRGCFGSSEGGPGDRLARAFLNAAHDVRFGGVRPAERAALAAEVSYMRAPRFLDEGRAVGELELGTHGLGVLPEGPKASPVILLPDVARDSRLDARGMLEALHRKAGPIRGAVFLFEVDAVVVRRTEARRTRMGPADAAAAWLSSLVRPHGAVRFAIDARTGAVADVGRMHHGRGASVIHALAAHGGYKAQVARGRARLAAEIRAALAGRPVDGWPDDAAEVAGTLALAVRAGVRVKDELSAYARTHEARVAAAPWHAGQVVAALGVAAPPALWRACLDDLERQPWAPWTVLGLRARGEPAAACMRAVTGLVVAVRDEAPYRGAVFVTKLPEVAITALTVEALLAYPEVEGARDAVERARDFLRRQQLLGPAVPAVLRGGETEGAFVAAPTATLLRGDVTAHALLAIR